LADFPSQPFALLFDAAKKWCIPVENPFALPRAYNDIQLFSTLPGVR